MSFNLLTERWLSVRTKSGRYTTIAPHELTDPTDPPVAIATGRADLDAGVAQFLIGLIQTACTPDNSQDWEKAYSSPPSAQELVERFAPIQDAFELLGDGPRFMQDPEAQEGGESAAMELLQDFPSENTRKNNADLFYHRSTTASVTPARAAAMLYTLQATAGSGGRGHRTSLRGGGPLTCVLLGDTLWRTCWLNILDHDQLKKVPGKDGPVQDAFLWMSQIPTSSKNEILTPDDVTALHHYWAMPRRLWLEHDDLGRVISFKTLANGPNYGDLFEHPLTPYRQHKPDTPPLAIKLQESGLPYRDWVRLTLKSEQGRPATNVFAYYNRERYVVHGDLRVWVSGHDMDNAKARNFYEGIMPVFALPDEHDRDALRKQANYLVAASEYARFQTSSQIKSALFERPKDAKGDMAIERRFWSATEAGFFEAVSQLRHALDDEPASTRIKERWLESLLHAARELFNSYVLSSGFVATEARREAEAWNMLNRTLSPKAPKFRKEVGLTPIQKESA